MPHRHPPIPVATSFARQRRATSRRGRAAGVGRAFTLLEVMLVLVVLVAIAAMAAPALQRTLDSHRLRGAADNVRIEWAKTRVRAMESGRTFAFRYVPAGNTYTIEPFVTEEDLVESSDVTIDGAPISASSAQSALPNDTVLNQCETKQLPEGITFLTSETVADTRGALLAEEQFATGAVDTQWSAPIFFYADGSASTARLSVANQRSQSVCVAMRGLTGVIEVSDVQVAEVTP